MYVIRDAKDAGHGDTGWLIFNTEDGGCDDIINLQSACRGDAETVCSHLNKLLAAISPAEPSGRCEVCGQIYPTDHCAFMESAGGYVCPDCLTLA